MRLLMEQLHKLEARLREGGGASRIEKQHKAGKMTARERIGVYPALGHIHLRGRVHTGDARAAAYEVARGVPGVKDVENALLVDPNAEVIPIMAGITNEEDRVPGGN